jgi:hypothetical protein
MNIATKFMVFAGSLLLFLVSLTIALNLVFTHQSILDRAENYIYGMDKELTNRPEIMTKYQVSGAVVLQSIFQIQTNHVDIQVNDQSFPKDLNIDTTNTSMIDVKAQYVVTYERNPDGSLYRVIFKSI